MAKWIAAYNLPTAQWTNGGKRSDYDQEHYDIYEVEANYRDEATENGRKIRRAHLNLTPKQQQLLQELKEEVGSNVRPGERSIEINKDEIKAARRLATLGLIEFAHGSDREVFLTAYAYNPSMMIAAERRAKLSQYALERRTPEAQATGKPKIRL